MNTDTPEKDQWETYCDECYYHMWRLRRKTERGWHDGFHIQKGEEAKELCDLLNKLERELDRGLKENRDLWSCNAELTEQRDTCDAYLLANEQLRVDVVEMQQQRDEARGQRDRLAEAREVRQFWKSAAIDANRERDELKAQRDEWANLWADLSRASIKDTVKLERELTAVTEQRDRLAVALRECREDSVELLTERDWWQHETRLNYHVRYELTRDNIDRADKALQSLTRDELSNQ